MARIYVDSEGCKGCGLCVDACPRHLMSLDGGVINSKGYNPASCTDMDACTGCMCCAIMCPDVCITVEK